LSILIILVFADIACIVDKNYQGFGIVSYLLALIIRTAREEGITGFTGDVVESNTAMLKIYEKGPIPAQKTLSDNSVYKIAIPFESH
jgi:ribosomal protein S18 acetylase RimI-like enzyme